MPVPEFTFSLRLNDGVNEDDMVRSFRTEDEAIRGARAALQVVLDIRAMTDRPVDRAISGVAIGAGPGRTIWLGEWEWSVTEGWTWQSSD